MRWPDFIWRYLYRRYMRSPAWQATRERVFRRYGRRCWECGSTVKLHVHHRKYPWPIFFGWEPTHWLVPLCRTHHEQVHGRKIGR